VSGLIDRVAPPHRGAWCLCWRVRNTPGRCPGVFSWGVSPKIRAHAFNDAERCSTPLRRHRRDHRHVRAVFDVGVAMRCDQISFFQKDADEDGTCRRDGKQQVSGCHRGRRPECEQKWMRVRVEPSADYSRCASIFIIAERLVGALSRREQFCCRYHARCRRVPAIESQTSGTSGG
jgi:hypothetical protein